MTRVENRIVRRLQPGTQRRLLERCERIDLRLSTLLCGHACVPEHVFFPVSGFVVLVIEPVGQPALEVGMVGRECVVGAELLLGAARSPWKVEVIGEGVAWRIDAASLREVCTGHPDLRRLLLGTVLVRLHQQALASACDRFHSTLSRVARWLLMTQDRAMGEPIRMTHEFIAHMLGVRRVSVTLAANELQREGLIAYRRGDVHVLDRGGLQSRACSCYETDRRLLRAMVAAYVRYPTYRTA